MRLLPLLTSLLFATPAMAEEPPMTPYLTAGALELTQVTPEGLEHAGLYGMVQFDAFIPLADRWNLVFSTGFEMAPENGNWGFYEFFVLDHTIGWIGGVEVTIEPQIGMVHNAAPMEDGRFFHTLNPTAGVGMAFITKGGDGPAVIPTVTGSYSIPGGGIYPAGMVLFSVPIN